jgi:hypothetical protein
MSTPASWLNRTDFVYLRAGEIAKAGDEYTDGTAVFVVGSANTSFPMPGQPFDRQHECYHPRRAKSAKL